MTALLRSKTVTTRSHRPKKSPEQVTARGGDLLTRTLENHSQRSIEGAEPSGDDEVTTPNGGDKMDLDEPSSGSGRSTRGELKQHTNAFHAWI